MTRTAPDPAELAEALIACPSVTPATGEVFDRLTEMLSPLGFAIQRFIAGEAPAGPVENLFAIRKGPAGSKHFAFAGHVDVVPAGEGWTGEAFAPQRRGDLLYGRGAVDMKGAVAAMVAAVAEVPPEVGTISFIITGDEEGEAVYGTRALIELIRENGEIPDLCLVGEPTSVSRLGDTMKIGRRGSVNVWFEIAGREGHVAYPHLADNPIPRLVALLAELEALELDGGTEWFQPSNLEITDIEVGNPATNVIPARATARISIRFNDRHSGAELSRRVTEIAQRHGGTARPVIYGEPFITLPGGFLGPGRSGGRGRNRDRARALDQRWHLGCAVPQGSVPCDRIRPRQRDDAQARRGGRARRPFGAGADLSPDRRSRTCRGIIA